MSISCTLDIRLVSRPQTVRFAVYSHSSLFPIRTMLDNEDQCVSSDLGRVFKKLVWPFYLSLEYWKKPLFSCREGETRRDSEETVWLWKVLRQEMSVLRLRPTQRAIAKTAPFQNQVKWPAAQFSSVFNHKVNSVCPQSGNIGCYLSQKKDEKKWRQTIWPQQHAQLDKSMWGFVHAVKMSIFKKTVCLL